MRKNYVKLLSSTLASLPLALMTVPALATIQNSKIVYGEDNRVEIFQTEEYIQKLASSTAAMVENHKLLNIKDLVMLPPYTLKEDMNVCENENFVDQPSAAMCSGFLVGPDLLVTAGHCINSVEDCSKVSWVFDYAVNEQTGRADVLVNKSKVYKCKEVLDAKLDVRNGMLDFSLIKLDRVVNGRAPLKYRVADKVAMNTDVFVIGHPSGLPSKYAGGASVLENSDPHFFQSNLDTFGGNSGSAVFNAETNEVEGILVRGAKDYVTNNGCRQVNTVAHDISNFNRLGESVSRITDIKSLKYRDLYLKAAQEGDLEQVKELLEVEKIYDIYDNEMNSALHVASANDQQAVVAYLLDKVVAIDRQNLMGDTALHVAVVNGNKEVVKMLLASGANLLIRNKMGKTPLDSTSFFQMGIRRLLKAHKSR